MFKWPNVFDIWNTYLTEFLERYGGTKLERARDLFEQCLETCPEKFAKAIYILYAKLELEHGSAKRGKLIKFIYSEKATKFESFDVTKIMVWSL